MNLSKSIEAMTKIHPLSERLHGDETRPLTDRLDPISDHMKAASIPKEYQSVVLYSFTIGKALDAAKKINTNHTALDAFVAHIGECYLYENDIQSR